MIVPEHDFMLIVDQNNHPVNCKKRNDYFL